MGYPFNKDNNDVNIRKNPSVNGKKVFHTKDINWSYLYLGKEALTHKNRKTRKRIFKTYAHIFIDAPPKNIILKNADINNIWIYSPKKNNAKVIEEYSTL